MTRDSYSLFLPPNHLAEKGSKAWDKSERAEYLQWFLTEIPNRLQVLSDFLSLKINTDAPMETFLVCAKQVCVALSDEQFFQAHEGKKVLTPGAGYSIGADVGVLLAQLLLGRPSNLTWRAGKGPKSYISLNLPVLWEFGGQQELDPVLVGINLCRGSLRESSVEKWKTAYEYWRRHQPKPGAA